MISRFYVACGTCGANHILRIQIGHGTNQQHRFHCVECKEVMEVELDLDQVNAGIEFHLGKNCVEGAYGEGTPLYLSPDFVADAAHMHKELTFPSIDLMKQLMATNQPGDLFAKLAQRRGALPPFKEMWQQIHKAWRLQKGGKYHLANKLVDEFSETYSSPDSSVRGNLFYFLNKFLPFKEDILDEILEIKKNNETEFAKFLLYYQTVFAERHRADFFEIVDEYFLNFQDFAQVLIYVQTGAVMPNNAVATSVSFDKVKKFYASAYEFFGGAIGVYTALNNIKCGRSFDQLEKCSLEHYLTTDKAKRRITFSLNDVFSAATSEYDSSVRNASFHNWFKLKDDKDTIEYRSGGTGAIQNLSYVDYLYRCSILLRELCNLMCVELIFDRMACLDALVTTKKK